MSDTRQKFIATISEYHVFDFGCPCGTDAELGVPTRSQEKLISCPNCGRLYFYRKPTAMFAQPRLISVGSDIAQA